MDLIDRYGRHPLYMAAVQAAVFVLIVFGGLWSIGARMLVPMLVMVGPFAALVWLTLHRPWDWQWDWGTREGMMNSRWSVWDPGVLIGGTLALWTSYGAMLRHAKWRLEDMVATDPMTIIEGVLGQREWVAAWREDTLGLLVVTEAVDVAVVFPLVALAFVWFFLPS